MREVNVREEEKKERAAALVAAHQLRIYERTDRTFAALMALQWIAGIAAAIWISPRTWAGSSSEIHVHVWAAIFLGGAISFLPVVLALAQPGRVLTRHVIAAGQMLTSALLIHLTGGRIETHFHVFGSLAFLAFYRDSSVLLTATTIVAADHFLRGLYWPQSVFGVLAAEPWRWLEHAGWVLFEDAFLFVSIAQSHGEMAEIAERQARLEAVNDEVEDQVRDRTAALRESEAALRHALERATESDRLKSEFLASMSHEIRTPLNGVIGMTGLLMDTSLSAEQRDYAETARSSAETLLGLLNDILDFSKVEAGKLDIEPIAFDLEVASEEVIELFAAKADDKDVNLALRYAPDAPENVVGDAGRIRQVLTNLVANAVKFTDRGHVFVNVEFQPREEGRGVFRFTVEDTGIGIPADQLPYVFDRFMQGDASTTRKYGGTGLGLAITRQLVQLMGGEVGVLSEPGAGSTFWFTLPLPVDSIRQRLPEPIADLNDVRVLVVDDNEVNRRIFHELITRWGMRNGTHASGEEALAALRTARAAGDPFQIAILDMHMPGMDGEMLARRIKADPDLRDTVLLLLTSAGKRGDGKRMSEAGFAAYLTKPVRPSVLMDALQTAWAARKNQQEAVLITRHSLAERTAAEGEATMRSSASDAPEIPRRVLIVEDNVVNQRVARLILERLGCRVDHAGNGKEAVEMVGAIPYDIVFMDCQMPVMDGYEATAEIRRVENGRRVPIVAMTAHALQGDREKCLDAGMDDYIAKPIRREALLKALVDWTEPDRNDGDARPAPAGPELDGDVVAALRSLEEDGGAEFVRDLVESYVRTTRRSIASLREAVAAGDLARGAAVAHDVKGASSTLGSARLANVCRDLETSLRGGSVTGVPAAIQEIERQLARIEEWMSAPRTVPA